MRALCLALLAAASLRAQPYPFEGRTPPSDGADEGFRFNADANGCRRGQVSGRNSRYLGECGHFGAVHWVRAVLSDKSLDGIDLEGAFLGEANFNWARLRGARLAGIQAARVQFERADMRGALLQDAYLHMAKLRGAKLQGARLDHADLEKADLRGADLSGVDLSTCRLLGARFDPLTRTNLSKDEAMKKGMIYEPLFSPGQLRPVDESRRDRSFAAFRGELLARLRKRDLEYLRGILDPDMSFSFGSEGQGAERFLDSRGLRRRDPSGPIWEEMSRTVDLGCVLEGDRFICPYVTARWPPAQEDGTFGAADFWAVIEPRTELKEKPDPESKTLRRLDYDLIKAVRGDLEEPQRGWLHVITSDGLAGYVKEEHTRSPIDHRAVFAKQEGRWKMLSFIGGD